MRNVIFESVGAEMVYSCQVVFSKKISGMMEINFCDCLLDNVPGDLPYRVALCAGVDVCLVVGDRGCASTALLQ